MDITGVEPLGRGEKLGDHAASMKFGEKGIMHGFESIMLKDENGEPAPVYSIASGLDYPSVGPEHAFLHDLGRVKYETVSDEQAMEAFFKLSRYEGIRFILISPPELKVPDYIKESVLDAKNIDYRETTSLDDAMEELDILYMTRVQKERFFNEEDYIRMKDCYILDKDKMKLAKPDMYVLHPLPRVNEISVEVDDDPRAAYFRQAQNGVYVRMALIMTLLEVEKPC